MLLSRPRPRTLRNRLGWAVTTAVTSTAALAVGVSLAPSNVAVAPVEPAPSQAAAPSVLDRHEDECWTAEQEPKAALPGAAIVRLRSGREVYTARPAVVDAAFNEALADIGLAEHRPTAPFEGVVALCK